MDCFLTFFAAAEDCWGEGTAEECEGEETAEGCEGEEMAEDGEGQETFPGVVVEDGAFFDVIVSLMGSRVKGLEL